MLTILTLTIVGIFDYDDDANLIGWAFIADTILGIIIGVERGQ